MGADCLFKIFLGAGYNSPPEKNFCLRHCGGPPRLQSGCRETGREAGEVVNLVERRDNKLSVAKNGRGQRRTGAFCLLGCLLVCRFGGCLLVCSERSYTRHKHRHTRTIKVKQEDTNKCAETIASLITKSWVIWHSRRQTIQKQTRKYPDVYRYQFVKMNCGNISS